MSDFGDIVDKMLTKQDQMSEDITDIKVILARNTESLEQHIRRTEVAEENIDLLRKEMQPIKDHVTFVDKFAKLAGFISIIIGAIAGLIQIFK